MPEHFWIPVEEILFRFLIVKVFLLVRPEQRIRVLLQGLMPRLEPMPGHVKPDLLVGSLFRVLFDVGGGRVLRAMGTHPIAEARANGSHEATDAMSGTPSTHL